MPTSDTEGTSPPSPEAAFAALGDETRLAVLRTLGRADEPLAFTELRQRVGYETAGNFSYHLDELLGHFVQKTDVGYQLRRPGERVVEAILSGAVTEAQAIERTGIDRYCPYCDATVELSYRQERVTAYCTECAGVYDRSATDTDTDGLLGYLPLPPAGIKERSLSELEAAAWTWGVRDMIALSNGVCPRCSARLDQSVDVCPNHGSADGLCSDCQNRHRVQIQSRCTNCIFEHSGAFVITLMTNTEFLAFVTAHGLNPVLDHWDFGWDYREDVHSIDPFDAEFAFEIDGETLIVTVDEHLAVAEVSTK